MKPHERLLAGLMSLEAAIFPIPALAFLTVSCPQNDDPIPHLSDLGANCGHPIKAVPYQTPAQLQQHAQAITVKILAEDFLGSGILIASQGNEYWVLTNAHVLKWSNPPFQIQTADGVVHEAQIIASITFAPTDLQLLRFQSANEVYPIAKLGSSSQMKIGDSVIAAGFPAVRPQIIEEILPDGGSRFLRFYEDGTMEVLDTPPPENLSEPQQTLAVNSGQVKLLLENPLEEGYSIGYTSKIMKGMSGGPVLNAWGELIAINGVHANPLWSVETYHEDGTLPDNTLQEMIPQMSWGIPVERIISKLPD